MAVSSPNVINQLRRHEWSWSNCVANDLQELQALVVHCPTKKVLLKWEEDRWVLPARLYNLSEFRSAFEPVHIIPDVCEIIGAAVPLAFLRQVWRKTQRVDVEKKNMFCVYEKAVVSMEYTEEHTPDFSLKEHGYQWIAIQAARVFHFEDDAAAVIQLELKWLLDNAQPDNRLAWQRPGWLSATESWMKNQLRSKFDASFTDEITQLRSSHLGVILRADTTAGRFFLKCTSAFANDAAYTQALARISPEHVATPVAVDVRNQMMLTADYGEILGPCDLPDYELNRLTTNYAHLQMATIGRVEELISAGFPDLRLPKLLDHIDRLTKCPIFRSLGNSKSTKAEVEFFCENVKLFKTELMRLKNLNLPATVTHNDLFSSNIYQNEATENYMFFDFVEGYVSHPFALWLSSLREDRYLEEWSSKAEVPMDELSDLLYTGGTFHLLALIVLRLQESEMTESPESEECLVSARSSLRKFNASFSGRNMSAPSSGEKK